MSESELGLSWIENTLSRDTTLQGLAPGGVVQTFPLPGTTTPYMVVTYHSGSDQVVFGGGRAYAELRMRAIVAGPLSALSAIQSAADRIDTLLTVTAQTSVTGGTIIASFRDMPVSSDEWVDAAKWHIAGGEYRVFAKSS